MPTRACRRRSRVGSSIMRIATEAIPSGDCYDGRAVEIVEQDRVVMLRAATAQGPGESARQLAHALIDACAELAQRIEPLNAVVLDGSRAGFFRTPPTSAADLDAAVEEWRQATTAIADIAVPTVAVLRADAIGPAWELALACDLRLA